MFVLTQDCQGGGYVFLVCRLHTSCDGDALTILPVVQHQWWAAQAGGHVRCPGKGTVKEGRAALGWEVPTPRLRHRQKRCPPAVH